MTHGKSRRKAEDMELTDELARRVIELEERAISRQKRSRDYAGTLKSRKKNKITETPNRKPNIPLEVQVEEAEHQLAGERQFGYYRDQELDPEIENILGQQARRAALQECVTLKYGDEHYRLPSGLVSEVLKLPGKAKGQFLDNYEMFKEFQGMYEKEIPAERTQHFLETYAVLASTESDFGKAELSRENAIQAYHRTNVLLDEIPGERIYALLAIMNKEEVRQSGINILYDIDNEGFASVIAPIVARLCPERQELTEETKSQSGIMKLKPSKEDIASRRSYASGESEEVIYPTTHDQEFSDGVPELANDGMEEIIYHGIMEALER